MSDQMIQIAYLVVVVLFILGLKGLTHPKSAVRGNQMGALAMLIAVLVTLTDQGILSFTWILAGLIIGSGIGAVMALKVQMTQMPQLVALFNGFGGIASFLVAGAYLITEPRSSVDSATMLATALSGLIGAVTFSGSLVAFGKLAEFSFVKDISFPNQQIINAILATGSILFGILMIVSPGGAGVFYFLMVVAALVLGYLLVISIGGADMPVVISLLNSYSGLAAAATGFVLNNTVLIVAGSLVGASGVILTRIMCDAMNRSLLNVLFGKMQASGETASADEVYQNVKSTSPEEVAMLLEVCDRVMVVPGYGMAVAQAQHAISELTEELTQRDVKVEFGIHPVAGRMPGHMNVLLAEADIPYEMLVEDDVANSEMEQVDMAIVLGANDVVNPMARTNPESPIAGMPIINVDKAKTVIVIKRSLSPGFAGIPNPLFAADNAQMLYGDGKQAVVDIIKALRES